MTHDVEFQSRHIGAVPAADGGNVNYCVELKLTPVWEIPLEFGVAVGAGFPGQPRDLGVAGVAGA